MDYYNDYLLHYGVKGMKWRKHKRPDYPNSMSEYNYRQTYPAYQRDMKNMVTTIKKAADAKPSSKNIKKQVRRDHPISYRVNKASSTYNKSKKKALSAYTKARNFNAQHNPITYNTKAAKKRRSDIKNTQREVKNTLTRTTPAIDYTVRGVMGNKLTPQAIKYRKRKRAVNKVTSTVKRMIRSRYPKGAV